MLAQLFGDFRRWLELQAVVREMERLDDHALNDIGVVRGDIRSAIEKGVRR